MNEDDQIVSEEQEVTAADLKQAKEELKANEEVEEITSDESSAADDDTAAQQDDATEGEDDSQQDTPTLTKKFPNLKGDDWEAYAKQLEVAYDNSFKEVRRLKEQPKTQEVSTDDVSNHPAVLYAQRQMEQEAQEAFTTLAEKYPQVQDLDTFEKFRKTVEGVSNAIYAAEGRQPTFAEAYEKSALVLGWGNDTDLQAEKLGAAVKGTAAMSKTSSAPKTPKQSKVTQAMIIANRKMYPNKTDQEIREELEPYVQ